MPGLTGTMLRALAERLLAFVKVGVELVTGEDVLRCDCWVFFEEALEGIPNFTPPDTIFTAPC